MLAWAALISLFSTDSFAGDETRRLLLPVLAWLAPEASRDALLVAHAALRKLAHLSEYAVLGALLVRALAAPGRSRLAVGVRAALLCLGYAAFDELHQLFVPSRTAASADVILDATGAWLGVAAALRLSRARPRRA